MVDYARELYGMISGIGDAYSAGREQRQNDISNNRNYAAALDQFGYQKTRDATKDSQWQQEFGANQDYRNRSLSLEEQRLNAKDETPKIETFYDENGRETKGIYDPSAPNGFRPVGGAKPLSNGMTIETLPDGTTRVIQGGQGKPLPAEIGARIGLGDQFLNNDLPQIREEIKKGALGGGGVGNAFGNIGASVQMMAGAGVPGQIDRRIQTGLDALRRNLTGQGMSASEANDYVNRYVPGPADRIETINSKLDGLEADLRAVAAGATAGRAPPPMIGQGGAAVGAMGQGARDSGAATALDAARAAIAAGKDRNAVRQRLIDHGIDPSGL